MELTFETVILRNATMDKHLALRVLGQNGADSFLSLIADLKDAMFVGELADEPQILQSAYGTLLRYRFAGHYELVLEPVILGPDDRGSWREAHRVKLLHILNDGDVLL